MLEICYRATETVIQLDLIPKTGHFYGSDLCFNYSRL